MFANDAAIAAESARQAAVDRLDIRSKRGDQRLQQITERAAAVAGTPLAAISIIDRARQWLVARTGVLDDDVPRAVSFCAQAIHRPGEAMVVPDASQDARFMRNPLVASAPFIRFYVGIPLVDRAGYPLGALCVIDHERHDDLPDLYDLAALAREAERIVGQRS
ncbi:MAG: GAF domain-containing protein [Sphingomonas taxi]|uniref:GAF domain-containing protein n=1 Tax=Sphingomonas taxi TaxID=1549858 RepID=A0A2W5R5V5_9SPHN|nr:MAG: GAF domain-containing protein [Sphingomonas taxi]